MRKDLSLSVFEKSNLRNCFDLSLLSAKDREFFYSALFNYMDEFPFLTVLARDLLNTHNKKINIVVKKLNPGTNGYQKWGEIGFSTQLWKSCIRKNDSKNIAATLWHELMHSIQEDKLMYSYSKRGYMVYRQFIEAEAMSYSNLIMPRCKFEEKLYKSILKNSSSEFEAQKRYIGVSTRLRLNADRELAKIDAENIMGKDFSASSWEDSEKYTIKHWRDFYYQYHQEYAQNIWETKANQDNELIAKSEKYFEDRYGIKISAKASISEEVINNYGLSEGIGNTQLITLKDSDVFEISKWRGLPNKGEGIVYTLDMPNMDPSYINDVYSYIICNGIKVKKGYAIHKDGFSSRLLQIENTPENVNKFFEKCKLQKNTKKRTDMWPKVDEKECCYGQTIFNGKVIAVDVENPPIFRVGKNTAIKIDFNDILSAENKKFLKEGGVILMGRNPTSLEIEIPREIMDKACRYYTFRKNDMSVSRLQGYLFVDKKGRLCYKECSVNGSIVQKRDGNLFDMQNQSGHRLALSR